jgi:uncharacterized protein YggU (UPF0235/DUF167 family)
MTILRIHLTPGAKHSKVQKEVDMFGEVLYRVRINAKPIDGEANKALLEYIIEDPKAFDIQGKISMYQISLVSGETNRHKTIALYI